jgi:hypothetical protein
MVRGQLSELTIWNGLKRLPFEAVATNLSTSRGTAFQPYAPSLESDIDGIV